MSRFRLVRNELIFIFGGGVPRQPFLVESDDHLGTFDVCLARWDQIRLVAAFPLMREQGRVNESISRVQVGSGSNAV